MCEEAAARLVVLKGDANYRRLLGDAHWAHETAARAVLGAGWPPAARVLCLRTCKSEVLVGVPDAAGLIVREVQSAELETQEGRAVLEAARRLHAEGREIALAGLLLEINDPAVQSLLVAVDETSATRTPLDAQDRVHHLEDALRRRSAQRQAHRSARTLKTSRLDPGSEAALLEQLVAQRRAVQGMTDVDEGMTEPKDG